MKKLTLAALFVLTCFSCYAQTDKGSFHIGAGGLPIIYPDNQSPTGYALRINVGYFVTENISIGLMPFHGKVDDIKSTGANALLRYYILKSKVLVFGEATTGLGFLKYDTSPELDGTMHSFTIGSGLGYSINNKFSVEVILQYGRLRNIPYPEQTWTGKTFIPTIGIQYYFRK